MFDQDVAEEVGADSAGGEQGNFETAQRELYAADAVNIEPYATATFAKETTG